MLLEAEKASEIAELEDCIIFARDRHYDLWCASNKTAVKKSGQSWQASECNLLVRLREGNLVL